MNTVTLSSLWLDGLEVLAPHIDQASTRSLMARVDLHPAKPKETGFQTAKLRFHGGADSRAEVAIDAEFLDSLHRVEAVEVLVSIQTVIVQWLRNWTNYQRDQLCRKVGCDSDWASRHILNRWSRIAFMGRGAVSERFEDRPVCPLCQNAVSSGEKYPYKHENCMSYARTVLVPAILQARKEANRAAQA